MSFPLTGKQGGSGGVGQRIWVDQDIELPSVGMGQQVQQEYAENDEA